MRKSLKITILAAATLPLAALTAAEGMLGFEAMTAITQKGVQAGNWSMEMVRYDAKGESMGPEMAMTMCITPEQMAEQSKMMSGNFVGMEADPACKQTKGAAADGKFEYAIACEKEGKSSSTSMTGTYAPTESNMTIAMNFNPAREGAPAKIEMKTKRTGDCAS